MSYIYLIKSDLPDMEIYKIGYSKNPKQRLKELKTANPHPRSIIAQFKTKNGRMIETLLHKQYKTKKVDGEWFYLFSHDVDNFLPDCKTIEKRFDMLKESENPFVFPKANKLDAIWKP